MMSWYDESPELLEASVRSLAGVADHLVALDGRYALFHGPTNSPASNYEAISRAAAAAGVTCQLVEAAEPWDGPNGGEPTKRTRLLRLAEEQTDVTTDWVLSWDADFIVDDASEPGMLRNLLARTPRLAADVWLDQSSQECHGAKYPSMRLTILFRALRGFRVEHAHYQWTALDPASGRRVRMWDMSNDTVPVEDASDLLFVQHVPDRRVQSRRNRRWAYYMVRDARKIEQPVIDPATRRAIEALALRA